MLLRLLLVSVCAVLLACGGPEPPTQAAGGDPQPQAPATTESSSSPQSTAAGIEPSQGGGVVASGGAAALEEVYAQLEGLEGEEREARLVELAQQEEGQLSLYTAMNLDNSRPLADEFTSMHGIEVTIYRAGADAVSQRYTEEIAAGYAGADIVSLNAEPLIALDEAGLLLPLDTPTTDNLIPSEVHDNWATTWRNVFTAAWNSDLVPPERAPSTWEEVLAFDGAVGWGPDEWDWMGTLVVDYFMEQKGMTEEEAIELFRQGAEGNQFVGHTPMVEMLASGSLELGANVYNHTVNQFIARDAPLEWQPAVEPLISLPDGMGIALNTQRPAGALLFIDYMMTAGQEVLAELGRTPASPNVEGDIAPDAEIISINFDVIEEREKWQGLMDEIMQQ